MGGQGGLTGVSLFRIKNGAQSMPNTVGTVAGMARRAVGHTAKAEFEIQGLPAYQDLRQDQPALAQVRAPRLFALED